MHVRKTSSTNKQIVCSLRNFFSKMLMQKTWILQKCELIFICMPDLKLRYRIFQFVCSKATLCTRKSALLSGEVLGITGCREGVWQLLPALLNSGRCCYGKPAQQEGVSGTALVASAKEPCKGLLYFWFRYYF